MSGEGVERGADGYRRGSVGGASIRADVVDVYVFRRGAGGVVEFLQLLRARRPLAGTWQPVMGHCEPGESAAACAARELCEEVGLKAGDGALLGMYALEQVRPFYLMEINAVVLSPRFAAWVSPGWSPTLNEEHGGARWASEAEVDAMFMWPGQREACREVLTDIVQARAGGRAPMGS